MNRWLLIGLCCMGASSCYANVAEDDPTTRVQQSVTLAQPSAGLSLLFSNGASPPKLIIGNGQRFVQEIDLVESVSTTTDQGISPLLTNPRTAALDWDAIHLLVTELDPADRRLDPYRGLVELL